jgi:pyruvate ferredoxin oxidoreductase beta subunit
MNTGIQRSGATPKYASTTTSPAGKKVHGKTEFKKNMPMIMAAHGCYVATASVAFPHDLIKKVQKALKHNGVSYVQVFCPCIPGWGIPSNMSIELAKLAFKTKVTPLFEVENGIVTITNRPSKELPVEEYLLKQKRFKHLQPKEIEEIQRHIDKLWEKLVHLEETRVRIS